MATKQYEVRVPFTRVDRKTGKRTHFKPGDTYSGDNVALYLAGVDDQGPLITEKTTPASGGSGKES